MNKILKGQLTKFKLISGSKTNSGLSYHTTLRPFKSRVPVPLMLRTASSRRMAAFLEENELFVPDDDDGDDD